MATKRTASDILAEQHWKRRILSAESAKANLDNNNSNSAINPDQDAVLLDSVQMDSGDGNVNVQTYNAVKCLQTDNETFEVKYAVVDKVQDQGSDQSTVTNQVEVQNNDVHVISQNLQPNTNLEAEDYVEVPCENGNENIILTVNNQEGDVFITQSEEGYVVIEATDMDQHVEASATDHNTEQSQCLSPADHCHQIAGIQAELVKPKQEMEGTEQEFDHKIEYSEQNQKEMCQNAIPSQADEHNQIIIYQSSVPNQTQDTVVHFQCEPEAQIQESEFEDSQNVADNNDKNTTVSHNQESYQHENLKNYQYQTSSDNLTVYNKCTNENTESTSVSYPVQHPSTPTDSTSVHSGFVAEKSVVDQVNFIGYRYPSAHVPTATESYGANSCRELNQKSQFVQPNTEHENQTHFYQGQVTTYNAYPPISGCHNVVSDSYQNASLNVSNVVETQPGQPSAGEISYPSTSTTYSTELQSAHLVKPVGNVDQHVNVPEQANSSSTPNYGSQETTESLSQSIREVLVPMQNGAHLPEQTLNPSMQQNQSVVQGPPVQYVQQQNVQTVTAPAPGIPTTQQGLTHFQQGIHSHQGTMHEPYRKNDTVYPNVPIVPSNSQYPEVIEQLFNSACYMPGGQNDPSYQRPLPVLHHSDVASIENNKDNYYPVTPTGPHPSFCSRSPYSPMSMQPQYWPPPQYGNSICSTKPYGHRNYRHSPYPFPPCHYNASHSPSRSSRGYHNGHSRMNHGPRHRRSYSSPYAEYGHGDHRLRSRGRNSSCCHTPHGDSDCSMFSSDNCHSPSPVSGRARSAIRGRPSGDFSVEGAQFHSQLMRRGERDSYSSTTSDSDDNSFSIAQPGLGGQSESSLKSVKNSLCDPNNPVLSNLPAPGLQRTKFLVSTYIDYLVEENERVTDMSKAFTPPTYLFLEEEQYVLNAHKEDAPFPSNRFSKFIKDFFPHVDAISVPENKSNDNSSSINRLNLSGKNFEEFAHTVFFGCQDLIEKNKADLIDMLPHTVTAQQMPTAVAGN